jgi:hypothetical protein
MESLNHANNNQVGWVAGNNLALGRPDSLAARLTGMFAQALASDG